MINKFIQHFIVPIAGFFSYPFVKDILNQIYTVMEEENIKIDKTVYLFQFSYYTRDGREYISGGGERYISDIAALITKKGYRPILFQQGNSHSKTIWYTQRNGILVIGIPGRNYIYPLVISSLHPVGLSVYSGYLNFGNALQHPNIMISHGITWDYPGSNVNCKAIFHLLHQTDCLISVDTNTLSWLRSTYSKYLANHQKDLYYIPNYADLNKYQEASQTSDEKIHIIFPRRCCPERGFWLISRILPDILYQYPQVTFTFIGFIHEEKIEQNIRKLMQNFPTQVSHQIINADAMEQAYQQADITLIPTLYSEGTSLSCIEAMASGNAIIATNIGGLPNLIIDGYNGILINPAEQELKEALELLIHDELLRKKLGHNASQVAQAFSKQVWEKRWNKLLTKYLK